ncbi:MAG: SDR family oxidoreductase [Deltaproteobacteria bacterium]|nr:SDR family oxidoreductase [Deltaproteobacteria bacterium]
MSRYDDVKASLVKDPRTWVVTGAAGFIGSHLVEELLRLNQRVIGLDNFATGKRENVADVARGNPAFTFYEGDINDRGVVDVAVVGADYVLHQAALGSVPRSIKDPLGTHRANVDGFVTTALAAKDARVKRFVYASSSSVYGDHPDLPKLEDKIGQVLSPYAATKRVNEVYAHAFQVSYGLECIGLRYFNVFGPRQDKDAAYAAVIPIWVGAMLRGEPCVINGDGDTSRDFCFVKNAVQANLLAATAPYAASDEVYNVACGARTTLSALHALLHAGLEQLAPGPAGGWRTGRGTKVSSSAPTFGPFRDGDVRHSLADIGKAARLLGYAPTHDVQQGIDEALSWYVSAAEAGAGK